MTSPSKPGIHAALLKAQEGFLTIEKSSQAHQNKYAPLEVVLEAVGPALRENDLVITQPLTSYPARRDAETGEIHPESVELRTILTHVPSGESIESSIPVSMDANPQRVGSQMTYFRRYCLISLLGVQPQDEDDEADSAARAAKADPPPAPAPEPAPKTPKFLDELRALSEAHAKEALGDRVGDFARVGKLIRDEAGKILGIESMPTSKQAHAFKAAIKRVDVEADEDGGITVKAAK